MPFFRTFKRHRTVVLLVLLVLGLMLSAGHWHRESVIRGDAHGYCSYLASWVIHHDFDFSFYADLDKEIQSRYWLNKYEGTGYFPKLTMGVAYAQLPLYLIAHAVAGITYFPQDGWSTPYQLSIALSGILFLFLGLLALNTLLKRRFSNTVSSITLILLLLATNLLYYAGYDGAVSHIYSFSLFSIALWAFDFWIRTKGAWGLRLSAFVFGWLILIRPTDAIFLVVPVTQIAYSKTSWKQLFGWNTVVAFILFLLPFIPQLLLWKMVTGSWVYYSYGGEQIFWTSPHVMEGLFSFRNGWLLYTPIMVFSIIGIWFLRNVGKGLSVATAIVLPIQVYVVFSWWCWYYGSSLSIRPMIDLYPLLALPLAAIVRWVFTKYFAVWVLSAVVVSLLIYNNSLQTTQFNQGQLSGSDMTKAAFELLLFNADPPSDLRILGKLRSPDTDRLMLGKRERMLRDTVVDKSWELGKQLSIAGQREFSPVLKVTASDFETTHSHVMRVSAEVKTVSFEDSKAFLVMSFVHEKTSYGYQTIELHKLNLESNEWQRVEGFLREPIDLPDDGYLEAYFWFQSGDGQVEVRDLKIEQLDCPYIEKL